MEINKEYTIIGIDGGGTKTRGVLVREGQVRATDIMGTTRIGSVGLSEATERVLNMIRSLCEKAEIQENEIDCVVVGLAGIWLEEEKLRAINLLKTIARGHKITLQDVIFTSDAELALHGAMDGGNGIVTIVGTGSIAIGNPAKKKLVRCGGWGVELDDEGSGAWIGREGLTAVVRALDGRGKATSLTQKISEIIPGFDPEQPRTIVKEYNEGNFSYQVLTPMVMECAEQGDPICLEIITRSSKHLCELPMALAKNFKGDKIPVVLMGGIIEADTLLAKMLIKEIEQQPKLQLIEPKGTALTGAIAIGQRMIEEME